MQRRRHIWQKLGDLTLGLMPDTSRDAVACLVATPHDTKALGGLMPNAYRGTLDDEGETPERACDEVRRFFDGACGPVEAPACIVGEYGGWLVCASLHCLWDGGGHLPAAPLVAHAVTAPGYRGQRLGAAAIARSLRALAQAGLARARAVITAGNFPSEATFRRLGFEALPD